MRQITHGSLFSGIGGAELAAEWNGIENKFHCDINEFGCQVLDYWYPNSKSYGDIKKTDFNEWRGKIDILSGGFPCQPFSTAGRRRGADDDRYLWPEMLRVIAQIQPRYIVGENVAGIVSMVEFPRDNSRVENQKDLFGASCRVEMRRGRYTLERVCGDLEEAGYSVQPIIIPACAVNAPHRRDRVWILAKRESVPTAEDAIGDGRDGGERESSAQGGGQRDAGAGDDERVLQTAAHAVSARRGASEYRVEGGKLYGPRRTTKNSVGEALYTHCKYSQRRSDEEGPQEARRKSQGPSTRPVRPRGFEEFPTQPPLCVGDDGIPLGMADAPVLGRRRWAREALKTLGNAWVPQVAAEIFAAIVQDIKNDCFQNGNSH